jgi:hypothetical protein
MRGAWVTTVLGLTLSFTSAAQTQAPPIELEPWRVGPGFGIGNDLAYVPGPGAELFVAADGSVSRTFRARGEFAAVLFRHEFDDESVFNPDSLAQLDTRLSVTQLRLLMRGLAGVPFSNRFTLYAGIAGGYANTWNSDVRCGDRIMKNLVYAGALQPSLTLDQNEELELSFTAELGRTPNAYCTIFTTHGVRFYEDADAIGLWTSLRARYRF